MPVSDAEAYHITEFLDMLPSRTEAYALLGDVVESTGVDPDLANLVLQHLCVVNSSHRGLVDEYISRTGR